MYLFTFVIDVLIWISVIVESCYRQLLNIILSTSTKAYLHCKGGTEDALSCASQASATEMANI